MPKWSDVLTGFAKTLIDNGDGTFAMRTSNTVTPDSFTVTDDNTIASTDQYVDMALPVTGVLSQIITHNQAYTGSVDSVFFFSDANGLYFFGCRLPVAETTDTYTVKHSGAPAGAKLRIIPANGSTISQQQFNGKLQVRFVTDNGGAGNTHFTTAGGLDWLVEDVDAATYPGWEVQYNTGNGDMQAYTGGDITPNISLYVVEPGTGNVIVLNNSNAVASSVYLNTGAAEANRLEATFGDVSDHTGNLLGYTGALGSTQVVPIYINPTASTQNRLQHDFVFAPFTLYIYSTITNQFFPIVYNANASTDGYRLRWKDGSPGNFCYNNTSTGTVTNTKFYTSTAFRPSEGVVAAS